MKRINQIINNVMRFFMAVSMFALVAGGFWQVFTRWVLKNPSTYTDEFMRYLLIWAGLLGSAYCFHTNQHLSLDLFSKKLKGPAKLALLLLIELVILAFVSFVFLYGGLRLIANTTNASPVLQIPLASLYMVLPISGGLILLARFIRIVQLGRDCFRPNDSVDTLHNTKRGDAT